MYEQLPISVVINHTKSREVFFNHSCLPHVRENNPVEVFIEDGEGGAFEKRNVGAAKATQPYLMFVDDNSYLYEFALVDMMRALEADPGATFAYSDVRHVHYPGVKCPTPPGVRKAFPWDPVSLRDGNYIETMSLMRREAFPGFGPSVKNIDAWALWLTLAAKGHRGIYIPRTLLEIHHIDPVISTKESSEAKKTKHGLE